VLNIGRAALPVTAARRWRTGLELVLSRSMAHHRADPEADTPIDERRDRIFDDLLIAGYA
jgi:hypothetical protein